MLQFLIIIIVFSRFTAAGDLTPEFNLKLILGFLRHTFLETTTFTAVFCSKPNGIPTSADIAMLLNER